MIEAKQEECHFVRESEVEIEVVLSSERDGALEEGTQVQEKVVLER